MLRPMLNILLILAVISIVAAPTSAPAQQKAIQLVLASWEPPNSPSTVILERFAKDLEAAFPGRVKTSLQFSGALGKPAAHYDLATSGSADISFVAPSFTPGRFPVTDLLILPIRLPSAKIATSAIWYLQEKGYLNKEYADVKVLWLSGSPPYQIQSAKKPIKSLSDFRGLKVRAAGQMGKAVEAMGGVAVAMPMTDVYTSLQRGVVDVTVNSFDTIAIFKLNEVTTSVTEFNLACLPMVYVMNKDAFAKLPADIQAFLEQTKTKYSEAIADYTDGRAAKGLEIVKNEGKAAHRFETTDLDKMPRLFAPIWADYIKQFESKGFPVKAASDDLGSFLGSKFGIKNPILR